MKWTKKKKLMFLGIFWLLLICLGEIGFRGYSYITGEPAPTGDSSLEHERDWVKAHLKKKTAILPSRFVFDPYLGWKMTPNLQTPETQTNSQGMRNRQEFSIQPQKGRKRLLFLGDSYTFGFGVNNDETFVHFLSLKLPEMDILNMAIDGTGTDQQLVCYEVYGKKYQPDVVILGFYIRDYFRNLLSFRSYFKPYYQLDAEGKIQLQNSHIIPPEEFYQIYTSGQKSLYPWNEFYLGNFFQKVFHQVAERNISSESEGWQILAQMMVLFQQEVQKSGAVPMWIIIPTRYSTKQEDSKYKIISDLCEQQCQQLNMLYLRLDEHFREYSEQNPDVNIYRSPDVGGHFSAEGHQFTAELIYKHFQENEILKKLGHR